MSEKLPPDLQSTQSSAPDNIQAETQGSVPITHNPEVTTQDLPPADHGHRGSNQETSSALGTSRVNIQGFPPTVSTRPIRTQEPPPETSPRIQTRRVSIQEPPPIIHNRRVSIQEPLPIIHNRRVSIQEPLPIIHNRRVSIQEPLPVAHTRRVSIQEPLPVAHTRRFSTQEPPSALSLRRSSTHEPPSISYNRWVSDRDNLPTFQNHQSHTLTNIQSSSNTCQPNTYRTPPPTPQKEKSSRAKVDVPPSITQSPTASIESIESIIQNSQEPRESVLKSHLSQSFPDDSHNLLNSSLAITSKRLQKQCIRQFLPFCWRLLHEARKISRYLSLVLALAGMLIICLISLGLPWIHFQVPLMPPGHPAGPLTTPINTILFVQCPDVSCLHEYDQNAYLLDLAWAFLLLSSISSFCLCVVLIGNIFFTSSHVPMLDFFFFISSIVTGVSIILGVLFYMWQADKYLQEGMTYRLGISFYLAWSGVFLFLMTGFFSYMNYMNFWSILAHQAVWS